MPNSHQNLPETTKPDQLPEQPPFRDPAAEAVTGEAAAKLGNVLSGADANLLFDEEKQKELFDGLRKTLQMKENLRATPDMAIIEAALIKDPIMMRNMWRLQKAGAQLVVTSIDPDDKSIEFADAAENLDIKKQEAVLAALTEQEKERAIEAILAPIIDGAKKASAKAWLLTQLHRSGDAKGLNYVEALVYAVAHGGSLISYDAYDAIAKRDPNVYEGSSWTWYFQSLSDVMSSGDAPCGDRDRGRVNRDESGADYPNDRQGGRIAGLRVKFA